MAERKKKNIDYEFLHQKPFILPELVIGTHWANSIQYMQKWAQSEHGEISRNSGKITK